MTMFCNGKLKQNRINIGRLIVKNLRKKLWGLILSGVLGFVSVPTVMYAQETVIYEELDLINAGKASEGIVADFTAELVEDEELEEDSRYVSYVSNDLAGALVPGKKRYCCTFYELWY